MDVLQPVPRRLLDSVAQTPFAVSRRVSYACLVVALAASGIFAGLYFSQSRGTTAPPVVARAVGPVDAGASLARQSGNVDSRIGDAGLSVATTGSRISVAAEGVAGSWTAHRDGAIRSTPFGLEAMVFRQGETEELLAVDRRVGLRTWRWQLSSGGLTPRLGSDGAVSFGAGHKLSSFGILPAAILDAEGHDVTPAGARWSLKQQDGAWWLQLRLDDAKLPLPYVIDPTITHRASVVGNNGAGGGTSITLATPAGVAPRDLLVAQIAARGGGFMTISTPAGWTQALTSSDSFYLRQSTFYRIAGASEPASVTFSFGGIAPSEQAVGGISAYYGMKASSVVDRFATSASNGTSTSASAAAITTQAAGSLLLTELAAATGTTFSTPSGMTERFDAQSADVTATDRASVASDSAVQTVAGSTGAKASTITSSHWLAHLLSFRADDVFPAVSMASPGANLHGTVNLTATPTDADSGVARVQFQRSPAGAGVWTNAGTAVTVAPYTRAFDTRIGDGLYDFRAVATDNAGNVTNSAVIAGLRIDNTLPVPAIAYPAVSGVYNAAGWNAGCAPDGLCGTATDASGSGVQLVDLSLRRSSGGLYWNGTSFASATEVFVPATRTGDSWSFPLATTSFPADGAYVLRVRATDVAGNAAIAASRTFTYDTTPPNATISTPPPASTNVTAPTISFTSNEGGSHFECQLDGAAFSACTTPIAYSGLADGLHTFSVRSIDVAGNVDLTPASSTWRIDTHAPVSTLTNPVAGSKPSLTVTAAVTATDDIGVVGVQFTVDGVALGAEDKTAPYTASWNTRLYSSAPHTVAAVTRDAAGNTVTSQALVTVDNDGVVGPGLVAAYAFDEGQGATASDSSGNGKLGTMVGARWASGKNGSAAFLDGINDNVSLPPLGTFYRTAFTFEAWVLKRGTRKDVTVMGSWNEGGPMIWVNQVNGHYILTLGADGANYVDSGQVPATGRWQHVAGSYDGAVARIYIDGVEVANRAFTGEVGTSNTWRIGAFRADASGFFDGLVDDVRIYNRALPVAEIRGDMTASVGPTDTVPPTAPTGLTLDSSTATSLDLSWTASTDNLAIGGYNIYRDGTLEKTVTARSATIDGLACSHTYAIAVEAYDVAGNVSPRTSITAPTAACDSTPPLVSLTSPETGTVVGGTVLVSATASDATYVAGVQFRVDGVNVGPEDTVPPYTSSWNTRLAMAGLHTVSAVARDAAGNTAIAQAQVTVDNSGAPGPGLVAGYGFDEGTGTVAGDGSGNGNTGTLVSGAGWTAGKYGNAVSLDGDDDRVDLPSLTTFYRSGFTFEAWVRKSGAKKDVAIVGTWDGGGPMIWIDHINGHYMLTLGDSMSNYLDSGRTPVEGVWQHIAATYDGSVARFYIDGVLVASQTVSVDIGSTRVWRIGAYRSSPTGFFDGAIDDVRIYDRALPTAEVLADMSTPESADIYPPSVDSVSPDAGSTGIPGGALVKATFSEPMDPGSINATSFVLHTGGVPVPATVHYDAATRTATLTPNDALARDKTYSASLAGGTGGISDLAGNPLRSTSTWSFTTLPLPQPILVVGASANPFSTYARELLEAEGLDEFETLDASQLSAQALVGSDVVVLGDIPLSAAQVTALTAWVQGGGNLVALHPDKQLSGLLGITDAGSTLANAYLQVDTSSEPGTGIVGQTMQFHGTADRYTLAGARAVATLYSNASTPTANPALTLHNVGSLGGHAAAFTYDLARSVVYTRQGNPAWVGQERDGAAGIRPDDLFYGASATDPQPDWVDTNKLAIPQADEQQRLLANLITFMARDRKPLPRFWYFPRDLKAAIVMTGDDHGDNGTAGRLAQYQAASAPGCSVVDWECVRSTAYTFNNTSLTDAQAKAYTDAGFELALHVAVSNGCGDWTLESAQTIFTQQLATFAAKFPSIPAPTTNRTHCVTWDDWFTEPTAEADHGIRLDTNYYAYPGSWIGNNPGFMTGSGIPMRFADLDGRSVNVFQAPTQMDDEADQPYPATVNTLLDRALGTEGYYGFFVANMHADQEQSTGSDAIIASAQARNVPVISSKQLLEWLDGRNASSFGLLSWTGNTMTFTVHADARARGLRAMLPVQAHGATLTGITRNGSPVSYTTQTVKGIAYALFPGSDGSYSATYG